MVNEEDLLIKGDDKNEDSGNSKKNNDTKPKRIMFIKTEKNKDTNSTTTSPTPAITQQRARISKKANADTASTHKIDSEEGEFKDDTFLEELFNTSMESLDSSEDSSNDYPSFCRRDITPQSTTRQSTKENIVKAVMIDIIWKMFTK